MKNSTASNRKTGRMITKNLIILVVLVVVVAIAIWAWFSNQSTATASGISVQSMSGGVEVSWDGKDYYDELTARNQEDVIPEKIGPAKSLYDGENPSPLKLITGNGLEFFEPYLNRRMGTELKNSDGTWQGEAINNNNSSGKYIDIDLYFRNDTEKTLYLAGDSLVSPTSLNNLSAYGNFSKDYISAATRVAFLNADKTKCNFIWAPNADIELKEGDGGYIKITDKDVQTDTISGISGATIPDDMLFENNGKSYQFWLPSQYYKVDISQTSEMVSTPMEFTEIKDGTNGKKLGLFIFTFNMDPSVRQNSPTFPFVINEQGDALTPDDINNYINQSYITNNNDGNSLMEFLPYGFNIIFRDNSNAQAPAFYIKSGLVTSTDLDITFGYNPNSGKVIVLGYSNENGVYYDRIGVSGGNKEVRYYELQNQTRVALVNTTSSLAVSSDSASGYQKRISFSNIEKTNIQTSVITANEMLTAIKTGSDYSATYTFKSNNNKFLNVADDGTVSFTNTATTFTLAYVDGFTGPVLKSSSGRFVVFSNGNLKAVTLGKLTQTEFVTVFTGSGYELITNSSESQDYKYYSSTKRHEEPLSEISDPPLFTSTTKDSAAKIIGKRSETDKIAVATLEEDTDGLYKAHIVMRIWVEGTDREAKTPLADGMFKTSFHFVTK